MQNERRKYDGETPEGVPCSFAYSSRAGNDPFLAQRTINTCGKWRESTCAFIQCGQLQHHVYPTVPPTPYFFLYEFLSDTM